MGEEFGVLGSLLGLGTSIAGAVPQFIPGESERQLEEIVAGRGGAGTRALQSSTDQAARNALTVASQGRGATRGLSVREALRQSDRIREQGAARAASMASQEQQSALGNLERLRQQRVQALTRAAAGLGQGLASTAALASSQGAPQAQQQQSAPNVPTTGSPNVPTAGTPPAAAPQPAPASPPATPHAAAALASPVSPTSAPASPAATSPAAPAPAGLSPEMMELLAQLLGQIQVQAPAGNLAEGTAAATRG